MAHATPQERYFQVLTKRVREDRYPSRELLDRIEASLGTSEQAVDYVDLLVDKMYQTRYPSKDIMDRIQRLAAHVARPAPPTRVVDAMGRGQFRTIADGIAAADTGDRILLRPGVYSEGLIVDKPLEIVGDGELGDVVVEAQGASALLFQASQGSVTNVAFRQLGDEGVSAIDITQGRLDVDGCDIHSESSACVAVRDRADPRLRHNRIHDGQASGIHFYDGSRGTIEDNDIYANKPAGVEITGSRAEPIVRRNRIHDGQQSGVWVHDGARGTIEDNDIYANGYPGVTIADKDTDPIVRRNRIHDGQQGGVWVHSGARGTIADNDIYANQYAGLEMRDKDTEPTVRRNRIHDGQQNGVSVHSGARGTIEDNDIYANQYAGLASSGKDTEPTVRRNRLNRNAQEAVSVWGKAGGTFEDNDLRDNARGAWKVASDSKSQVNATDNVE